MAEMYRNITDNEFFPAFLVSNFAFLLTSSGESWEKKTLQGLVSIKSLQISCGRKLFPGSEFAVAPDTV